MAFPRAIGYLAVPMLRERSLVAGISAAPALVFTAALLCSCSDTSDLEDDYAVPIAIEIDPLEFLGDVRCSNEPGAMRSYVTTLTDQTESFTLPSSPPTVCSQKVQFRYVVADHAYTAEIDGYEQHPEELTPLGGEAGSRHLVAEDGTPVAPRWTTACDDNVTAVDGFATQVSACDPLQDHGVPGATAIEVDPTASLGTLRCAGEGGEGVMSFDVLPESSALPAVLGIACPPAAKVLYNVGIAPEETYDFRIEATVTGSSTVYGASCNALTSEGLTATASCAPLSPFGALTIPIDAILEEAHLACAAGAATSYVVRLLGSDVQNSPFLCTKRAHFTSLLQGPYEAQVEVRDQGGGTIASATCAGDVIAGATTLATCSLLP